VQYANPAFARLLGCELDAVRGLSEQQLGDLLVARSLPSHQGFSLDLLHDERRSIELSQPRDRVLELALHRGGGHVISQVLHVRDISHQVLLDRLKSEFVTTAAHELRTPMTSIYGFAELLLLKPPTPERLADVLGRIHRQSAAMMHILDELLDLSRMEARRGKDFSFEELPLVPILQELVSDFQAPEPRDAPRLELAPDAALWLARVDRSKLLQALRNLLSNAYKYSPEGGEVVVRLRADTDTGDLADASATSALPSHVRIEVQDHGIGMTPEQLSHVSERFYRADKSGAIPGTGLGMAIVKEIAELMGGQLQLHSTHGKGSCMALRLRLSQEIAS